MSSNIKTHKLKEILLIAIATVIFLLLLSHDSYLYLSGPRVDSAWFFMCGKAWMNGMVPYVDFADSKGPLLWLIYGVGYLFSPHNYYGVFWIGCLFYTFTFYFIYRTLLMFISNKFQAFAGTFLVGVILFNPVTHSEIRAEDFSLPFIALCMWQMCRIAFEKDYLRQNVFKIFFLFGISFSCTFLMKYSITIFVCFFLLISVYYMMREKADFLKALGGGLLGAGVIIIPFLVYLILQGNLQAFINEYFTNTLATISNLGGSLSVLETFKWRFSCFLTNKPLIIIELCIAVSSIAVCKKLHTALPAVLFFLFFLITVYIGTFTYYYAVTAIMSVWLVLSLHYFLEKKRFATYIISAIAITGVVFLFAYNLRQPETIFNKRTAEELKKIESIYQKYDKPKVTCVMLERGFGITAEALPASKYWTRQNGITEEMDKVNIAGISSSDVVAMEEKGFSNPEIREQLCKSGFGNIEIVSLAGTTYYIFTK